MELSRKKVVIIAILAAVALAASGGLYLTLKKDAFSAEQRDGERFRRRIDPNLPNPEKQTPQQIISYIDSDTFKQMPFEQRMNYYRNSGEKLMTYHIETYSALTDQQAKNAYLDSLIDRMQAERGDMEKLRAQRDAQRAAQGQDNTVGQSSQTGGQRGDRPSGRGGRRVPDYSRMRARLERGTPEQMAQRMNFVQALTKRAEQRGITMPGPDGGPR